MTVSTQVFSRRLVIGSHSVCFRNALYSRWALILCFNQASENMESNQQLQIWSSLSLLSLVIRIKNFRWVWPQGAHPKSVGLFLFSKYKGCVEEYFKVQEFPPPQTLYFRFFSPSLMSLSSVQRANFCCKMLRSVVKNSVISPASRPRGIPLPTSLFPPSVDFLSPFSWFLPPSLRSPCDCRMRRRNAHCRGLWKNRRQLTLLIIIF